MQEKAHAGVKDWSARNLRSLLIHRNSVLESAWEGLLGDHADNSHNLPQESVTV